MNRHLENWGDETVLFQDWACKVRMIIDAEDWMNLSSDEQIKLLSVYEVEITELEEVA